MNEQISKTNQYISEETVDLGTAKPPQYIPQEYCLFGDFNIFVHRNIFNNDEHNGFGGNPCQIIFLSLLLKKYFSGIPFLLLLNFFLTNYQIPYTNYEWNGGRRGEKAVTSRLGGIS